MNVEKVLKLLEEISEDKSRVHRATMAYFGNKIEPVKKSMGFIYIKDGINKPFTEMEEFKPLFEKIKKVEKSDCITDEMFQVNDDICKLKSYIDAGYIVPPDKVVSKKESAITEAKILCENARNYFLIEGNEIDMFDKHFSIRRLKYLITKYESGKELTSDDMRSIHFETEKVRLLIEEGRAINFSQVDKDIEASKAIKGLLEKLDPNYYDHTLFMKNQLDRIYDVFELKYEYDKKAKIFYKFICVLVPKLLENIKSNCKRAELKENSIDTSEFDKEKIYETMEIASKIDRILSDKTVGYKFKEM